MISVRIVRPDVQFVKRPSALTVLMVAAIFLDAVWSQLWWAFTAGCSGHCGTGALNNARAMGLCSILSLPLVMFGFEACRARETTIFVPGFAWRLPFVLLLAFSVARLPIGVALACHGQPASTWVMLVISETQRILMFGFV